MSQVSRLSPQVSRIALWGWWKSENFPKIWKLFNNRKNRKNLKIWTFSENWKSFRKSEFFRKSKFFFKNLKSFFESLKSFWKSEKFSKIWKVFENLKSFWKSEKFLKTWKVSENLKSFQKSEKFPKIWKVSKSREFSKNLNFFSKIWKNSENLKFFRKSEIFQVRSCLLVALITCLKGHKSLRVLCGSVFQQWLVRMESVSQSVTREPIELSGDS